MLCRIAYEGVAYQKYSFSKQFLSDQARASCQVETFGLLQAVHSLISKGSSTVYHFLHLSLQELCAAYYVASLPDTEEQIMKLKGLKTITSTVDTEIGMSQVRVERKFERRNPRFDPVCQFYAALTQLSNSRVLAALMDEYPPLNDDFTGYECVSMSTEHFLDNLPHCVNDSQTGRPRMYKVSHAFLHCLYEAQNPSLVKELGVTALRITGSTSPPSLALAYLISIATGLKKFTYSKSSGRFSKHFFLGALVADALSKSTVEEVVCVSFDSTDSHPQHLSTMLKNKNLKKLEMHECFRDQLFPFSALLNGSIEDLTVSSSNIDTSIVLPLLEKLFLKRLNISCCDIEDISMEAISTIPITCTTLKHFNISGNYIGDIGADYLAKALVKTSLEKLDISDCQIRSDGIIAIASALKATQTLVSIDMHGNIFGTEGILAIAEALNHTSLQELDIRYCGLTEEKGLLAIALALRSNTTLNYLAISDSEGVDMELIRTNIVQSLMENPRFISVYIESHLLLTDELEAKLLTKDMLSIHVIYFPSTIHFSLSTASPLKEAFCSGNLEMVVDILGLQMPPVRTDKLVIHFRYGGKETIIDFSQKTFIKLSLRPRQLCARSIQCLSTTPYYLHLKCLDISGNRIGHSEAALVATFLQRNPVEILSISDCSIDSVGMESICSAIKTSSTLKSLNISKVNDVMLPSTLTTTLSQTPLKELDMSHCDLREDALAEVCTALSTNTTLTHLRLGGNDFILSKHATSKLILILTSTPLEVIDIHGCSIGEDSMDDVYSALSTSTTITSISLPNNRIGSSATSHFCDLVERSSLHNFDTGNYDEEKNGLDAIFKALRHNRSLTDLRLRGNRISHIAASCLATLLERSSLQEIDIGNCSKEGSSMEQFYEVLIHNSALTHLTLRGYSISHKCAIILAELLCRSSLQELDISNCDKEGSVMETLCQALTYSKRLTHLRLSGNRIGHSAASCLAELLRRSRLQELDISNCDKEGSVMETLCQALMYSEGLTHLRLSGNRIGHSAASCLAELLRRSLLQELDISNCDKEGSVMETLCQALMHNRIQFITLTHLRLSGNRIGNSAASCLAELLCRSCTLQELDISNCDKEGSVMETLCQALTHSERLTHLRLSGNRIGHSAASCLAELLRRSCTLQELDISNCDKEGSVMETLCQAVIWSDRLIHLKLCGNRIGHSAASWFFHILSKSSMQELDIRHCDVAQSTPIFFRDLFHALVLRHCNVKVRVSRTLTSRDGGSELSYNYLCTMYEDMMSDHRQLDDRMQFIKSRFLIDDNDA